MNKADFIIKPETLKAVGLEGELGDRVKPAIKELCCSGWVFKELKFEDCLYVK